MTIELTPEQQRTIERVIHSGAYLDPIDVISAALEALAEDVDDVAVTKSREHEPRVALEEVEAELRALGNLK
jgi:Arc/MetJ-type ribon-helix-helix transcriptional regulator